MFSDQTLITINVASIAFLVIMLVVMIAATRMRGGAGWAALIIVGTTVPVYFSNLARELGSEFFLTSLYICSFLNVFCIPALWLFVQNQLDKNFRFGIKESLHVIPAFISLAAFIIYYAPLTTEQVEAERLYLEVGNENFPALVNDVILFGQLFVYFPVLLIYLRKRKKYFRDNFADSDLVTVRWVGNFTILFFALFFIVFIAYVIDPRTDAWLIPILNTIGMAYLVYNIIFHPITPYLQQVSRDTGQVEIQETHDSAPVMLPEQMKQICEKVLLYLNSSKAYYRPDFSLAMLSVETGISSRNISRSINGYLHKHFFDLINEMRIRDAKKMLSELENNYTVDSIALNCGFRSRSTFYAAFKKAEGQSPAQWLKS